MKNHNSDLFLNIHLQGYCTVSTLAIDRKYSESLFESFNQLINKAKNPEIQKQINSYDYAICKLISENGFKLNIFDLSLGKIFKGGVAPQITSFLYLLSPNSTYEFSPFLAELEELKEKLKSELQKLLNLPECIYILKISKYTKADDGALLMPFHYDRTLFTVIIDTKESVSGSLAFQKNEETKLAKPSEFPLIFTGKEGYKTYGISPVSHGVVNFSKTDKNPERFSLILFIQLKSSFEQV